MTDVVSWAGKFLLLVGLGILALLEVVGEGRNRGA
jgi:hypothetical protein